MNHNSKEIIKNLDLLAHPEGGYYKETYRSNDATTNVNGDSRSICTSIYYLLENSDKSHFHKIQSDELWYFHLGQALEIIYIEDGILKTIILGSNLSAGEVLYCKIPARTWFACKIKSEREFSLVSCVVAPGFDFADFELASRNKLTQEYPHLKSVIEEFTIN